MNKQIKFKIWDKKLHVMWQPIPLEKLLHYLIFQNCPNADAYEALKDHFEEMVWLLSTGLYDKNGKEIYEGDIIKWGIHIGEVKWETYVYVFGDGFGLSPCNIKSEIIGNIFQNPELLKEQHENN